MKLTKKKEKEFAAKIRQIKELEQQKKQTEEAISDLKDEIKNFMEKKQNHRTCGGCFHGSLDGKCV